MTATEQLFTRAVAAIDDANRQDPNLESFDGKDVPKALLYSERMTHWLATLAPEASEVLRLAARAQHIRRWMIPRTDHPQGKAGYYAWRIALYDFHARQTAKILSEVGYNADTIDAVSALLRKEQLKQKPDMQLLEDVICLVFLESYFSEFAKQHDDEKLIAIIRKTWHKMSPQGHAAASTLVLGQKDQALIAKALAEPSPDDRA